MSGGGLGGFLFGNIDEEGKLDNEDFDEELRANLTTFSERIQDKKILLEGGFIGTDIIEEASSLNNSAQNRNVFPLPEAENFEDINELAEATEQGSSIPSKPVVIEPILNAPVVVASYEKENHSVNGPSCLEDLFDARQILKFTRLSAKPALLNATGRSYSRYASLRKLRLKRKQLHAKGTSLSLVENQLESFLNRNGPSAGMPSAAAARLRLSLINLSAGAAGINGPVKSKKPWHQSARFHDLERSLNKTKSLCDNEGTKTLPSTQETVKIPDNSHFHPLSLLEWENEIIWDSETVRPEPRNTKGMYVNLSSSNPVSQAAPSNLPSSTHNSTVSNQNLTTTSSAGGASLSSILSSLSLSNGALGGDSATSSATATALLALIRNQQMRSASISTASLTSSRPSVIGHTSRSSSAGGIANAPAVKLKFPKAPAARILNRELENGDWCDSIIWDVAGLDAQKLQTHLVLPLDDPELIFTALPVENLSKKLGRAEKLIAKRLKKLTTNNAAVTNPPLTSFAKPVMDKFNISNDKYYESSGSHENDANSANGHHGHAKAGTTQSKVSHHHQEQSKSVVSSRSSVPASFLGLHHSVPALQHSVPALKLAPPAFQTCRTKRELRLWHRPRLAIPPQFSINTWMKVKSPAAFKKTHTGQNKISDVSGSLQLSLSCNPSGGIIRSAKKLTLKDSSRFVLLEYFEEFPPLLMNSGMGSYIVLYYRKKSPQDTHVPRSTFALVQVLDFTDPSPFMMFGDVPAGSVRYALCNGLFRAPLIPHKSPNSDFLICRHSHEESSLDPQQLQGEFYLRPLESAPVMLVGQEFPLTEVPGPHSRRHNQFCRQRLQVAAYRLFNKDALLPESGHSRKRLKIGRLLAAFPQFSEGSIRKWLKDYAESTRAGKDSGVWLLKEDAPQMDEDELRVLVTPEAICQYESMMAEQQRLADAEIMFYDPLSKNTTDTSPELATDNNNDEGGESKPTRSSRLCKELDELTAAAPWNTTANFLNAVQGRCTLKLRGVGDPSGRGEAFSFVKAPGEKGTSSAVANSVGSEYRQDISRIWESHISSISAGNAANSVQAANASNSVMDKMVDNATYGKLVISRRFGADQWLSEEITDPLIIRAYLKMRKGVGNSSSAAEKKFRRGFVAPDALPQLSASDAAPLSVANSQAKGKSRKKPSTGTNTTAKPVKTQSPNTASAEKNLQIKCGACGQVGHMRTNRICPMFSESPSSETSIQQHMATTSSSHSQPQLKLKLKISTSSDQNSSNESIYPSPVLLPVSHRPKGPPIEPLQSTRKRPRKKLTPKQLHAQFLANQNVEVRSKLVELSTALVAIVDLLISLPTTPAFHKPVPRKLYPLYYKLISNPIDLSSIRTKAVGLSYTSPAEFDADFVLLRDNCVTFNGQDAPLSDVARDMLARVQQALETPEIAEIDSFLKSNIIRGNAEEQSGMQDNCNQQDDVSIMTDQETEVTEGEPDANNETETEGTAEIEAIEA